MIIYYYFAVIIALGLDSVELLCVESVKSSVVLV